MRARRGWAWPLVPVYAAALAVKDGLRRVGVLRTRRLNWPVVSVGSLSAGGAGKTPVVIALAELLKARGWGVDVLSRGYGRDATDKNFAAQVVPEIDDAATRYGDEPVLIARRVGVPVWVSAGRYFAGKNAEDFATEERWDDELEQLVPAIAVRGVHLLDDGFQHRQLARTMDVVLVTADDLEDALLPAGNRREGLGALRRADVVVVREVERAIVESKMRGRMRDDALVWSVRRELRFPEPLGVMCAGERPLVFCAIARPEGFLAMLADAGCRFAQSIGFGDHHVYGMVDVTQILALAAECGATGFVTTEKDGVKLSEEMLKRLRGIGPVCVVGLEVKFVDEAEVVRVVEARIS